MMAFFHTCSLKRWSTHWWPTIEHIDQGELPSAASRHVGPLTHRAQVPARAEGTGHWCCSGVLARSATTRLGRWGREATKRKSSTCFSGESRMLRDVKVFHLVAYEHFYSHSLLSFFTSLGRGLGPRSSFKSLFPKHRKSRAKWICPNDPCWNLKSLEVGFESSLVPSRAHFTMPILPPSEHKWSAQWILGALPRRHRRHQRRWSWPSRWRWRWRTWKRPKRSDSVKKHGELKRKPEKKRKRSSAETEASCLWGVEVILDMWWVC